MQIPDVDTDASFWAVPCSCVVLTQPANPTYVLLCVLFVYLKSFSLFESFIQFNVFSLLFSLFEFFILFTSFSLLKSV